jgi:hypothetical protein
LRGIKVFESQHRPRQPFDPSMVLFNDVVEVFALANLDTRVLLVIHQFEARGIRAALIDIDQTRFAVSLDGFLEKAPCGLPITGGS